MSRLLLTFIRPWTRWGNQRCTWRNRCARLQYGQPRSSRGLVQLVAKAHTYLAKLTDGTERSLTQIAAECRTELSEVSRILPLALLAPSIVDTIMSGPAIAFAYGTATPAPFRPANPLARTGRPARLSFSVCHATISQAVAFRGDRCAHHPSIAAMQPPSFSQTLGYGTPATETERQNCPQMRGFPVSIPNTENHTCLSR